MKRLDFRSWILGGKCNLKRENNLRKSLKVGYCQACLWKASGGEI